VEENGAFLVAPLASRTLRVTT